MKVAMIVIGVIGAIAGALSAFWWLEAAKVPPVYNTAMLGQNPEETARTNKMAGLNASAARAAAVAVGCQAVLLVLGMLQNSN